MISLSYIRHRRNGRKIIVGGVYWEEGAKPHDDKEILDMLASSSDNNVVDDFKTELPEYSKKGNNLENRAYSEPIRDGRLI